jgi:hypothetical protein
MKSTRISFTSKKDRRIRSDSKAEGELFRHLRATELTFASVANGVALALGVSQTLLGSGAQYFYVLNFCSFVLMGSYVRVSYYAPSSSIDQYGVDFAIAAIGIAAVFFFNRPDRWALCYVLVFLLVAAKAWQLADTLDPVAYRRRADYRVNLNLIRQRIRKYLVTAAAFGVIWLFFYLTGNNKTLVLFCAVLLLVAFFINIRKKVRHGLVVPKLRVPLDSTAAFQDGTQAEPRRAKKRGSVKKKKRK